MIIKTTSTVRSEANCHAWEYIITDQYPETTSRFKWFSFEPMVAYALHSDSHYHVEEREYNPPRGYLEKYHTGKSGAPDQRSTRLGLHILSRVLDKVQDVASKQLTFTNGHNHDQTVTSVDFDPADLLANGVPSLDKLREVYNKAVRQHVEELADYVSTASKPNLNHIAVCIGVTNTNDWLNEDEIEGPGQHRIQILTTH